MEKQPERSEQLTRQPPSPPTPELDVHLPERTLVQPNWLGRLAARPVSVALAFVLAAVVVGLAGWWLYMPPVVREPHDPEAIVRQFSQWKNTDDVRAEELLAPRQVPDRPATPAEAERLDADSLLRLPFRVVEVRPARPHEMGGSAGASRFVLVTRGGLATEPLRIEGAEQPSQRILVNPDLFIEVKDGKLYGVRAKIHED